MKNKNILLAVVTATVVALPAVSYADPWKDESGNHGGGKHRARYSAEYEMRHEGRATGGPPPWAPAHGYRRKHGGGPAVVYQEPVPAEGVHVEYEQKFGIADGTCNREAVGAVLGGVVGGAIGRKIGDNNHNKTLGTIAGAVIGVLVGKDIGRKMDAADQNCTGQVLERAPDGQTVQWRNPENGQQYRMTPTETFQRDDHYCRRYVTEARVDGRAETSRGTACRNSDGTWKVANRTGR